MEPPPGLVLPLTNSEEQYFQDQLTFPKKVSFEDIDPYDQTMSWDDLLRVCKIRCGENPKVSTANLAFQVLCRGLRARARHWNACDFHDRLKSVIALYPHEELPDEMVAFFETRFFPLNIEKEPEAYFRDEASFKEFWGFVGKLLYPREPRFWYRLAIDYCQYLSRHVFEKHELRNLIASLRLYIHHVSASDKNSAFRLAFLRCYANMSAYYLSDTRSHFIAQMHRMADIQPWWLEEMVVTYLEVNGGIETADASIELLIDHMFHPPDQKLFFLADFYFEAAQKAKRAKLCELLIEKGWKTALQGHYVAPLNPLIQDKLILALENKCLNTSARISLTLKVLQSCETSSDYLRRLVEPLFTFVVSKMSYHDLEGIFLIAKIFLAKIPPDWIDIEGNAKKICLLYCTPFKLPITPDMGYKIPDPPLDDEDEIDQYYDFLIYPMMSCSFQIARMFPAKEKYLIALLKTEVIQSILDELNRIQMATKPKMNSSSPRSKTPLLRDPNPMLLAQIIYSDRIKERLRGLGLLLYNELADFPELSARIRAYASQFEFMKALLESSKSAEVK